MDARQHMIECLARWVNNLPTRLERQEFLNRFAKGKPAAALQQLKEEMTRQWGRSNADNAAR